MQQGLERLLVEIRILHPESDVRGKKRRKQTLVRNLGEIGWSRHEDRRDQRQNDNREIGREKPPCAFGEKRRFIGGRIHDGHQIAADDEKYVDAEEAAAETCGAEMIKHDKQNCDSPQDLNVLAIDPGDSGRIGRLVCPGALRGGAKRRAQRQIVGGMELCRIRHASLRFHSRHTLGPRRNLRRERRPGWPGAPTAN